MSERPAHRGQISHAGDFAEAEFCRLTGAQPTGERALGDARIGACIVEIKHTTMRNRNLNQIRPYKYLPLIVFLEDAEPPFDTWYVIPAHQLVSMACARKPQHALSSFECLKLTVPRTGFDNYRVPLGDRLDARLRERALAAHAASDALPSLRDAMRAFGVDAERRARESGQLVAAILERHGLLSG
jgi:hypothetical protein